MEVFSLLHGVSLPNIEKLGHETGKKGNKPFNSVPKDSISSRHLPSTVVRDSQAGVSSESDSMPPVVPGCRPISAHAVSQINTGGQTIIGLKNQRF